MKNLKLIFGFLLIFFSLLVFQKTLFAQDSSDISSKYSVTFPIQELGDCKDYASCRTFCEDPVNSTACINFAKKKGFYKEEKIEEKFIETAKKELGCDSVSSCLTFCDNPENQDKCDNFAKKLEIGGGYIQDPNKQEIIQKAKDALGCDSYSSCVNLCSEPANQGKCDQFAKENNLRGGVERRGPGGCNSNQTCASYCSDPNNFSQCSKYSQGEFRGPGGCDSPDSCRTYCEKNPDSCRSYSPGSNGRYVPVTCPPQLYLGPGGVCTPKEKSDEANQCVQSSKFWNGQKCEDNAPPGIHMTSTAFFQPRQEMGNCSTPGSCYDWCKANPGKCGGFNPDSPRPADNYNNYRYNNTPLPGTYNSGSQTGSNSNTTSQDSYQPNTNMGGCTTPGGCYDWCKANPEKCGGFNPDSPRPADNYNSGYTQPYSGGTYSPQPYTGTNTQPNYSQPTYTQPTYTQPTSQPTTSQPQETSQPQTQTQTQNQDNTTQTQTQTQDSGGQTQTQTQTEPQPTVQGSKTNVIKNVTNTLFGFLRRIF